MDSVSVATLELTVPPAFVSWPEHVRTRGGDVWEFGASIGRELDAEQRLCLDLMYAERVDGTPASLEFAVIAARQNIKTAVLEVAALYDLFVAQERLIVWTSHLYASAKESFLNMKQLIDGSDELVRYTKNIYEGSGNLSIETVDGERLNFLARSLSAGRSLAARKVILDEAFALKPTHTGSLIPTLSTFRGAQVRYGSSAGKEDSDILRGVRDRGRAGLIAYAEWSAPTGGCAREDCRHIFGQAIGCALDRKENWLAANPAMEWPGRTSWRISVEFIQNERNGALTPAEFARERLGWWDEPGLMSLFAGWSALVDGESSIMSRLAFAVTVSPDRERAVISAAGLRAPEIGQYGPFCEKCEHASCHGVFHIEPIDVREGTGWVPARLVELTRRHGDRPIVVAKNGPAGALLEDLRRAGLKVTELSTNDVMDADAQFFDAVAQCELRHMLYPELEASIKRATRKSVGKRFVFEAREEYEEVSVLQGVSQAMWASRNVRAVELVPLFAFG